MGIMEKSEITWVNIGDYIGFRVSGLNSFSRGDM